MAESDNTLAGLVQMNNMNNVDIDVSDLLQETPWLKVAFATEASNGTNHSYTKETLAAGVAFRDVNTGIVNAAGAELEVEVALKLIDASLVRDKGLAMKFKRGIEAYMAKQGTKSLKSAFKALEEQLINASNGSGFLGLASAFPDIENNCVSNGGAVAAKQTSVYFLREGEDDIAVVAGNEGELNVGDVIEQRISTSADGTAGYTGLTQSILGWMGLQMGSIHSAARLANIDTVTGFDDDDIAKMLTLFPAGKKPNRILMNSATIEMLRQSRTATNDDGRPAPYPEMAFNVPIVLTDSIKSTEAIVTAP